MRGNTTGPTPAPSRPQSTATSPALAAKESDITPIDIDLGSAHTPHATEYVTLRKIAPLSAAPLSFGYGGLLRDGAGEGDLNESESAFCGHTEASEDGTDGAKSLKGRYIVRVGWDDVRGWLGEGGTLIGSSRCPSCEL